MSRFLFKRNPSKTELSLLTQSLQGLHCLDRSESFHWKTTNSRAIQNGHSLPACNAHPTVSTTEAQKGKKFSLVAPAPVPAYLWEMCTCCWEPFQAEVNGQESSGGCPPALPTLPALSREHGRPNVAPKLSSAVGLQWLTFQVPFNYVNVNDLHYTNLHYSVQSCTNAICPHFKWSIWPK